MNRDSQQTANWIDDIVNRGAIHRLDHSTGMATALPLAEAEVRFHGGGIATLPDLMAAKAIAPDDHPLWSYALTAYSEADIGFDHRTCDWMLLIIHGRGLLTPEAIRKSSHFSGFDYETSDFERALTGELPLVKEVYSDRRYQDETIPIFSIKDLRDGMAIGVDRFGVCMPLSAATERYMPMTKSQFMADPLMLAYAGDPHTLENYFDRTAEITGKSRMTPIGYLFEEERYGIKPYGYGLGLEGRMGSPILINPCTQPGRYVVVPGIR